MSINRFKELERVRKGISLPTSEGDGKRIFLLNGLFGVGKSWLVSQIETEMLSKKVADAVLSFDGKETARSFPEIISKLVVNYRASEEDYSNLNAGECYFNHNRFIEIVEALKTHDEELYAEVVERQLLKSGFDKIVEDEADPQEPDENKFKEDISKFLLKKGDVRLILETPIVSLESLIVDLMNRFFPVDEEGAYEKYLGGEPRKIVIMLDNYEYIDYSVNIWLAEEFIPYCTTKRFSDFISYEISLPEPEVEISRFFDFRFIIASRENLVEKEDEAGLRKFREMTDVITVEPLQPDELREFPRMNDKAPYYDVEKVYELTSGIPNIIKLWIEETHVGMKKISEHNFYRRVMESLFRNRTREQIEWICSASFLEDFEEYALRCFPKIESSYKSVFKYLLNSNELAYIVEDTPKILLGINKIVKKYAVESIKSESPVVAYEYENIARIYNDTKEIILKLEGKELDIVRNLAYFNSFDTESAIDFAFQTDAQAARSFIKKYPDWFSKRKHTLSLKDEYLSKLRNFNRCVDFAKYSQKLELIKNAWDEFAANIRNKINKIHLAVEESKKEEKELEYSIELKKQSYSKNQAEFFKAENELLTLGDKMAYFSKYRNLSTAAISIIATLISGAFAYFFKDIFYSVYPENVETLHTLQITLYLLTIALALVSIFLLVRGLVVRSRKKELHELRVNIANAEGEKNKRQEEMANLKEEWKTAEAKLIELGESIKTLNEELALNESILSEPFI